MFEILFNIVLGLIILGVIVAIGLPFLIIGIWFVLACLLTVFTFVFAIIGGIIDWIKSR